MNKIIKIILFLLLLFVWVNVNASFQPIKSTLYFENKQSKEIKYFETKSYTSKETFEIALIKFINKSNIWDKELFSNWYIKEVCIDKNCYEIWEISSSNFSLNINTKYDKEKAFLPNDKNNSNLKKFTSQDLLFTENINIIFSTLFFSIIAPFLFFLPLNLIVFYCFWYLLYKIFYKHYKINFFKYIYISSFFFYLVSTILLYYFWYAFINYNTMWFGFMSYIVLIWWIKLVLFFISKDFVKKYKEEEVKIKSNYENYIFYFYLTISIVLFTFNYFNKL